MARLESAEGSYRSTVIQRCASGHEHARCNRGRTMFIPPSQRRADQDPT